MGRTITGTQTSTGLMSLSVGMRRSSTLSMEQGPIQQERPSHTIHRYLQLSIMEVFEYKTGTNRPSQERGNFIPTGILFSEKDTVIRYKVLLEKHKGRCHN